MANERWSRRSDLPLEKLFAAVALQQLSKCRNLLWGNNSSSYYHCIKTKPLLGGDECCIYASVVYKLASFTARKCWANGGLSWQLYLFTQSWCSRATQQLNMLEYGSSVPCWANEGKFKKQGRSFIDVTLLHKTEMWCLIWSEMTLIIHLHLLALLLWGHGAAWIHLWVCGCLFQNLPLVLLLHTLSENEGDWSILPLLP